MTTRRYRGYPASPGFARGRARLHHPYVLTVVERPITPACIDAEEERLHGAVTAAIGELERTKERVISDLQSSESEIIDAHLTMLQDRGFLQRIKARMVTDLVNVEHALATEVEQLEKLLSQVENSYLAERRSDLRDIGHRVMRQLVGDVGEHPLARLAPDTVIVASELLPADTLAMDRAHVAAIITEQGGATSHTAILARALGIPLVTGVTDATRLLLDGTTVLVDGSDGSVIADPSDAQTARFHGRRRRYQDHLARARRSAHDPCHTADGEPIHLLANINGPEDLPAVDLYGLDGVGLFRTEFIYLQSSGRPSLHTHVTLYRRIAAALGDRPCTIRTFDLGADKLPHHDRDARDRLDSPAGNRGLRFAMEHKALFRTQLRALARAAKLHPNIRVLFPMVVGGAMIRQVLELFDEQCRREDLDHRPPVGAMIETPAALFDLDAIIDQVDFLSVGSNDLTQYLMAISRDQVDAYSFDATRHPAVLRAIRLVLDTAARRDCPVSICGEAAGDPDLARIFIGLGYRILSMSPVRSAEVQDRLTRLTIPAAEAAAHAALAG